VNITHHRNYRITFAALAVLSVATLHALDGNAAGAPTVRLEEVEVSASRTSALTAAPTDSKLEALQPQSVISVDYIANNITPTADYATIANLAPSVSNVETNGPGLSEAKHTTLRGFDDNSYNVTYDGIPFGDINDFSHHTTSYFPAKLIGRVEIERGPGTASDIGYATFGGTMALYSKDPRRDASFIPTLSYGSYGTQLDHFEVNSGALAALNGASAIASFQYINTEGYRTNADMWRRTYYTKYLQPLGKGVSLTFLGTYNDIKFNNPSTVTQAQINTLGRNYGLGNDPTKTDFKGYNYQEKQADMYYGALNVDFFNGWRLTEKFYTYAYNNESHESPSLGSVFATTSMTGAFKVNRYRAWGNYFLLSHEDTVGTFKAGVWGEDTRNPRYQYRLDYTRSEALDYDPIANKAPKSTVRGYAYDMVNYLKSAQPFAEYEWRATRQLMINAGLKYVNFTRQIDASINQTTRTPLYFKNTVAKTLPSISANYRITSDWSTYVQVAKGYLAPNLNQFYVPNPSGNNVKPAETVNYQVGTVYKTDRFNADFDLYYIDYNNYPLSTVDPITLQTNFALAKGAYFSGAETQFTYQLGGGFNAYANGSINRGEFKKSKLDVPSSPKSTAAFGVLYSGGGFFGALTDKYVGKFKVYDGSLNPDDATTAGNVAESDSYWNADLALGYGRKLHGSFFRSFKVKVQVNNLFDKKTQVLDSLKSNVRFFNVLPTRNYFLTVSGEF
jgi:iron complex outermembrane receptor protein